VGRTTRPVREDLDKKNVAFAHPTLRERSAAFSARCCRRTEVKNTNQGEDMSVGDDMMRHVPRLRRYARALLGNRELADDLVQDTLERGLRYASRFRPDTDLQAWLMTIMHNLFVNDVTRPARSVKHVAIDDGSIVEAEYAVDVNHVGRLEMRDLDSALQQLPAEQREVVLLVGLEEMSYTEVAQALNVPIGTVMSRLSRARNRLRTLLSREEDCAVKAK
jgi:RNA polymerase sigma-70 factor, ECF subfamily